MKVTQSTAISASEGRDLRAVNAMTMVATRAITYSQADTMYMKRNIDESKGFSTRCDSPAIHLTAKRLIGSAY